MTPLYPFLFRLDGMAQSYLWGGDKLRALMPQADPAVPLAEVWTLADRPDDGRVSVVANGPLAGTSLRQLMDHHAHELLGTAAPAADGGFPLLVKLIDAREQLSLQVHPPAAVAAELDGQAKTECWLILEGTAPGATVTAGFTAPTTPSAFEAMLDDGSVGSLLHTVPVSPGDCMFVPAGRLHAIGAGCLVLEIQESSNTTYRVFDWNRIDRATGLPRPLHRSQASRSVDLADSTPGLQRPEVHADHETLVRCPQFALERWRLAGTQAHGPHGSFELVTCLAGSLTIHAAGMDLPVAPWLTAIVPASTGGYAVEGQGTYCRTYVPATV